MLEKKENNFLFFIRSFKREMAGQGSDQAFGGISFAAPAPSSESSTPAPPNVKLLISSLHAKISVHYSSSHRQHSHHK